MPWWETKQRNPSNRISIKLQPNLFYKENLDEVCLKWINIEEDGDKELYSRKGYVILSFYLLVYKQVCNKEYKQGLVGEELHQTDGETKQTTGF